MANQGIAMARDGLLMFATHNHSDVGTAHGSRTVSLR